MLTKSTCHIYIFGTLLHALLLSRSPCYPLLYYQQVSPPAPRAYDSKLQHLRPSLSFMQIRLDDGLAYLKVGVKDQRLIILIALPASTPMTALCAAQRIASAA